MGLEPAGPAGGPRMEQSRSDALEHRGHAGAPDHGYFHGRHCFMWTPPPLIPPCVQALHAEDPTQGLVLRGLSQGCVLLPHFKASSHSNLVETFVFSFLAAPPHVLKWPSCRKLCFSSCWHHGRDFSSEHPPAQAVPGQALAATQALLRCPSTAQTGNIGICCQPPPLATW